MVGLGLQVATRHCGYDKFLRQPDKPSLAKILQGEAYAAPCLPGAECALVKGLEVSRLKSPVLILLAFMHYMHSSELETPMNMGRVCKWRNVTVSIDLTCSCEPQARLQVAWSLGVLPRLLRTDRSR